MERSKGEFRANRCVADKFSILNVKEDAAMNHEDGKSEYFAAGTDNSPQASPHAGQVHWFRFMSWMTRIHTARYYGSSNFHG